MTSFDVKIDDDGHFFENVVFIGFFKQLQY